MMQGTHTGISREMLIEALRTPTILGGVLPIYYYSLLLQSNLPFLPVVTLPDVHWQVTY